MSSTLYEKIANTQALIDSLPPSERIVLSRIAEEYHHSGGHGMRRAMMDSADIKTANKLVKTDLVARGHAADGRATYYLFNTYVLYVLELR